MSGASSLPPHVVQGAQGSDRPSIKLRLLQREREAELAELKAELAQLTAMPVVKCGDGRRDAEHQKAAEQWDVLVRASLRSLLEARHFTLRELARELKCSAPHLLEMIRGSRTLAPWVVMMLPQPARAEIARRLACGALPRAESMDQTKTG